MFLVTFTVFGTYVTLICVFELPPMTGVGDAIIFLMTLLLADA